MKEILKEELEKALNNSISISEILKELQIPNNGKNIKYVKSKLEEYNLDENILKINHDKKYYEDRICPVCGKVFHISKKEKNICCSYSCSNTYFSDVRHTEESKQKVSNTLKKNYYEKHKEDENFQYTVDLVKTPNVLNKTNCCICNRVLYSYKIGKIFCYDCAEERNINQHICLFDENKKKMFSNRNRQHISESQKKLVELGIHKGWKTRNIESYPETFFKKVLENNNIKYEFNFPISRNKLGIGKDGCYFLDFKIGDNIDLEIDGKQHLEEERKQHDIFRNNVLINNGYKVYRIAWNEINSEEGKQIMKEKIDTFLLWYKSQIN